MRFQVQIVRHPARDAVLPFTYPQEYDRGEAGRRADTINAMPGFGAEIVEAR